MFALSGVTPSAAVAGAQAPVKHSVPVVQRQLLVSGVQAPSAGGSPPVDGSSSEQQGEAAGHWLLLVHGIAHSYWVPLVTQIWFVPQHNAPQTCAAGQAGWVVPLPQPAIAVATSNQSKVRIVAITPPAWRRGQVGGRGAHIERRSQSRCRRSPNARSTWCPNQIRRTLEL